MSWSLDVLNPATGDDLLLVLKELVLPGQRPSLLDLALGGVPAGPGRMLCESLSFDMRTYGPELADSGSFAIVGPA